MDKGFPYDDADRDDALITALNHGKAVQGLPSSSPNAGFKIV